MQIKVSKPLQNFTDDHNLQYQKAVIHLDHILLWIIKKT